jgi:hypothetical protein
MRKTLVAAAVGAIVSAGAFLATGANAMTTAAPTGLKAATDGVKTAEQVGYVCYPVIRGGVWQRQCSWRQDYVVGEGFGYIYGYGPGYSHYGYQPNYGAYFPYYYRPYGYYGWGESPDSVYYRYR